MQDTRLNSTRPRPKLLKSPQARNWPLSKKSWSLHRKIGTTQSCGYTDFSKAGLNELETELADNAPTGGCSITPTAVSPRIQHVTESGIVPITTLAPSAGTGSSWESVEPMSRKVIIQESENEVIEIPVKGHGRRVPRRSVRRANDPRPMNSVEKDFDPQKDEPIGTADTDEEVSEDELKDAQVEAEAHREELDDKEVEDLFGDADEEGFEESSPERVTDDELFEEKDFENIQEYIDEDGNQRFWEVEESYDV